MGHPCDKFLPHLLLLLLGLQIMGQRQIGSLQFTDGPFQRGGKLVHIFSQHSDLVSVPALIFCLKIQLHHLLGDKVQLLDGFRDLSCDQPDGDTAQHRACQSHIQKETVGNSGTLADALQGGAQDKGDPILQCSLHPQIFSIPQAFLLQNVFLCLLQNLLRRLLHPKQIAQQFELQAFSAVGGGILGLGIGIHYKHGDIGPAADTAEFIGKGLLALIFSGREGDDGLIGIHQDDNLFTNIIFFQKKCIRQTAEADDPRHKCDKDH